MKKILLFAPRAAQHYWGGEPWSLLAVSRFPALAGYEIKIIQSVKGRDFVKEVSAEAPGSLLLGVSTITGYAIHESIEASKAFKMANPGAPVVWGGWHPSIMPAQVLKSPLVDMVVVGQGERTFLEIVDAVSSGRKPVGVLGAAYKEGDEIIINPPRPFEDVNNFPPMPYGLLDLSINITPTELGSRTIRYVSSQGCPHRCGFCVEPAVYGRRWYGLEAKRVVDEIEDLVKKYGINGLIFTDSNFFVDKKRAKEIAKLFIERGLKLKWGNANGRTRQLLSLGDETWDLLKRSGLQSILVGAESGIQEGLDIINKDTTIEDTVNLSRLCGRYGIKITFSLMIGLPYETTNRVRQLGFLRKEYDAILSLLDNIYKNQEIPNLFLLFIYTPYPGTPLYERSLRLGMIEPQSLDDWANFELNMRNTPWVPAEYARRAEMMTSYIFRWLDDGYYAKLKGKKTSLGPVPLAGGQALRMLARLRWKLKFFGMALDYELFKFALLKMKDHAD